MPVVAAVVAIVAAVVQTGMSVAKSVQTAKAAGQEAEFARKTAKAEAESQRIDDRYAAEKAANLQFSGISTTEGSPLFDDLENARRIQTRYDDRIYQGKIAAYGANLKKRQAYGEMMSSVVGGVKSIATSIFSMGAGGMMGGATSTFSPGSYGSLWSSSAGSTTANVSPFPR